MFTHALSERSRSMDNRVTCNCVHPGVAHTNINRYSSVPPYAIVMHAYGRILFVFSCLLLIALTMSVTKTWRARQKQTLFTQLVILLFGNKKETIPVTSSVIEMDLAKKLLGPKDLTTMWPPSAMRFDIYSLQEFFCFVQSLQMFFRNTGLCWYLKTGSLASMTAKSLTLFEYFVLTFCSRGFPIYNVKIFFIHFALSSHLKSASRNFVCRERTLMSSCITSRANIVDHRVAVSARSELGQSIRWRYWGDRTSLLLRSCQSRVCCWGK